MPYDVLERKFRALPPQSFAEVADFFDYIMYKFGVSKDAADVDEHIDEALVMQINAACRKAPQETLTHDATVAAMWEAVKHDSW